MIFVFTGVDKPGALQLRIETRPPHVAFLEKLNADGKLKFAGPFLGDDGKPIGSLVAVEAADRNAAAAMLADDPYAKAGLFASTEIRQWNWVFNAPKA